MSYFNEDQEDYMRSLAKIPPEKKCYCGWYPLGECGNPRCQNGKSNADRITEEAALKGEG